MKPIQSKMFAIGASVLLTLATEIICISWYWKMLSGLATVAILGLLFVAWVQIWSSYWYVVEENDKRVRYTALAVAFALSIVMALNAAVVLVKLQGERTAKEGVKTEAALTQLRADETIRVQKETGNWRAVREHTKAETERAKLEAEQKAREKPILAEEDELGAWIERYSKFWIFFIPFLCGILGKFSLALAIALPGGAEFGRPASRREEAPGENPRPST